VTIQEFNKTVDLYSDNLFRFFVKNISDREASQDLVQESFTKMWAKVRDVEFAKV
jgi:DNA-directed RNA polymerase specialized sigma24 family protein